MQYSEFGLKLIIIILLSTKKVRFSENVSKLKVFVFIDIFKDLENVLKKDFNFLQSGMINFISLILKIFESKKLNQNLLIGELNKKLKPKYPLRGLEVEVS